MINVQPNDIVDMLLNIPHAIYTFYFHTKACDIKHKKTYIILMTLYMSIFTFLQNVEIVGHELHVVLAFIGAVLAVEFFVKKNRFAALQYTFIMYIALILGEAVFYVVCFAIYHVQLLVIVEDMKLMVLWKITFFIFAFCIEYVVTKIWLLKVAKIRQSFNKGIIVMAVMILFIMWTTLWITLAETKNANAAFVCCISTLCMFILNIVQFMVEEQDAKKQDELAKLNVLTEQIENQKTRKNALYEQINKADETKAYILENINKAAKFLEEKKGEYAQEQLQGIVDTISVKYLYSNNKVADALLAEKAKLCDENGISLECCMDFHKDMPIDNARLCIILSNFLDNAIRACCGFKDKYGKESKPFISIKVIEQFGYLVIRQENSFTGIVENRRSGVFSEHGLGLEIVKNIADELNGELLTEHDDKVFVTSIGVAMNR